ncbi:hypothetical protein RBH20_19360 [Haloarcula sp. H-GB4]|uniref:hypothetical protein n=1 Tax=Haloarcula sp. H-GB4 TaxID=3069755 RepID=UPI0027B74B7A|nr:hypothetical protein [Haloarcula sp. H-GB4]MDQ2074690.1 hypothetical protein [Haloarcula sp. H-GB4]
MVIDGRRKKSEGTAEQATVTRGVVAALLLLQIDFPGIPDLYQLFKNGIEWFLTNAVSGLLDTLSMIFSLGYEMFLFYPNPANVSVLNTLWKISFSAYVAVAGLSFLYILLMAQYFPGADSADLQLHLEKVTKYFVAILMSRELIAFFVAFTHTLTGLYYQTSYDLSIGVTITRAVMDEVGLYVGYNWGLLAAGLMLITGLGLILILVLRMLIIYVTYALLPLLLAFKLVSVGPWKRVNAMGEKFIKVSAKLMLFGILVTALIWSSTLLTDFSTYDSASSGTFAGGATVNDSVPDGQFSTHGQLIQYIEDFFFLITPLLIIDFIGFKLVMDLL